MSKKADKSSGEAEDRKDKKGKKGKKAGGKGGAAAGPSVAAHPRARYQVRRAKGWGGLAGFGIAAYLSYRAGVPMFQLGLRSLAAGMVAYMLAWGCAVTVWRQLVLAELRAAVEGKSSGDPDLIPARAAPGRKPAQPGETVQPDAAGAAGS